MKKFSFFILFLFLLSCSGPRAVFTVEDSEHTAVEKIQFQSIAEDIDSLLWDFGDGNTSSKTNPEHRYLASGTYHVKLKVMKDNKEATTSKKIQVNPPHGDYVKISTPMGDMIAQLSDKTPKHKANFIKLAKEGFYDGLLFHRVIPGFMIQGGDPTSRDADQNKMLGGGGPGYTIPAEINDDLIHVRGALAAARTGDQVNPERKSSGSQFYIVGGREFAEENLNSILNQSSVDYTPEQIELYQKHGGTPFLDGQYTVFGFIIDGFDVIDKIAQVQRDSRDRPMENLTMKVEYIQ